MLRLNSHITLNIDVVEWMRSTGRFGTPKPTSRSWVQALCPYHDDTHPSFAVHQDDGYFKCQACGSAGTFVDLVMHVEGHATAYEAEMSLVERFGNFVPDVDEALNLEFGDVKEETFVSHDCIPATLSEKCHYLRGRGIDDRTLRSFLVGENDNVVALPWLDRGGRCVTVKYRSIADKRFWYDPPAPDRVKRMLYGLHVETTQRAPLLVVVEGEIDCMSVVQAGFACVALGGANFSKEQREILRCHMADEIVVFTDNDTAGRRVRGEIVDALVGHKRVSVVDWSLNIGGSSEHRIETFCKDANEVLTKLGVCGVEQAVRYRIPIGLPLKFD